MNWAICADPDSFQIYTLNIVTQEVHIEKEVSVEYRQKALKSIQAIENLLQLNSGNWLVVSQQVDKYRRRKIPSYLLQQQSSSVPIYLTQTPLSLAFSEITSIKLQVSLGNYTDQLSQNSVNQLELDVGLVTSADEVIKNILRQIQIAYGIELKTRSFSCQFILQVSGLREFITGKNPMLQFDRVRKCLRGMKFLKVILTEVPKRNEFSERFPPLIMRSQGQFPNIDWSEFLDVPILLWYPPYKLPKYIEPQNLKAQIKQNDRFHLESEQEDAQLLDDRIRYQTYKKHQLEIMKQPIILSGECDYQFKIMVQGIDNLLQLFEQDYPKLGKLRGTYNGIMPLQFITKGDAKPVEPHNTAKKKERSNSDGSRAKFEMPLKLKSKKSNQSINNDNMRNTNQLKFVPFGGVEYHNFMSAMSQEYGLDFIPYQMFIKCGLYHGSKLLTQWTQYNTRSIPFSTQPKFYDVIRFQGIQISQLPKETRLCFDVIIKSALGLEQIIGSAHFYIFNEDMEFRSGTSQLNIWPFCKVDPRLQCMSQYWGLRTLERSKDLNAFCQKEYARLLVTLDQFTEKMIWSSRNERQMSDKGLPKNSLTKEYYELKLTNDQKLLQQLETKEKENFAKQSVDFLKTQITALNNKRKGFLARQSIEISQNSRQRFESKLSEVKESRRVSSVSPKHRQSVALPQQKRDLYKLYPYKNWSTTPNTEDLAYMQTLLSVNPLSRPFYSESDKYILMICRNHYKTIPHALQIFLMAVDWANPEQVLEARRMLKEWAPLSPEDALPLLDAMYADEYVRLYAVERVSELSDDELALFMLEFTQSLMFEKNILNPLQEMLLERSLQNPWVVGHELFWLLRSQLHVKPSFERFALIIEQLLMLSGQFRQDILNEVQVNDEINTVAEMIKESRQQNHLSLLREKLADKQALFNKPFAYALDPRMESTYFRIEKCRVLDSKKLPLWLVSANDMDPSAENVIIIFKNGDDIRQDLLTLQLIKIMDKIWLDGGMDFRMKPYKVIATADQVGMIEVVKSSETISQLHHDMGALGAFERDSILKYLKQKNTTPQALEVATDNFLRSCAGYCVTTYILGIGDRHSGNIMISETGHLFHIDFGHFLGNFKSKFGFKRERTRFVFTPEMAFVMGGKEGKMFQTFQEYCTTAYNMVRKHGQFLINIFLMNLSAGMPELQTPLDVKYLQDQLDLNISDQEATTKFRQEIQSSLNDTWRQIDNFIHNIKRTG